MSISSDAQILEVAADLGVITPADAAARAIPRERLARLADAGVLERVARGRYRLPGRELSEHYTLALATSVAPGGVVCLLSALQYHGIGVQSPAQVWLALERGGWRPRPAYPPLRIVFLSPASFSAGIEHHSIEGRRVRIYSVEKTVADCFKFRSRVGLEVALEALADAWRQRRLSLAELNRFAAVDRVQRVMQPYIEALIQ